MHRKIIKVFLASPGDLKTERKLSHRIVDELNRVSADFWNAQIELIGWEDTVSKFGRAQELINQELDQCELFVGMMWQKWGSPPGGSDHPFTSGFEEEFQRSIGRREQSGSPEMALLFRAPEPGRIEDPGPELRKVLAFKQEVIAGKKLLFQEFVDEQDFELKFRAIIVDYVQRYLIKERNDSVEVEAGVAATEVVPGSTIKSDLQTDGLLIGPEAESFIRDLIGRPKAQESVTTTDIARLRLIALSVGRGGNDEQVLGAHDANALYKARGDHNFTDIEITNLISAGVASIDNENSPLWAWVYHKSKKPEESLILQYFSNEISMTVKVIKCITAAGYSMKDQKLLIDRSAILRLSLDSKKEEVKLAAIDYLASWGEFQEIDILTPHFEAPSSTIVERSVSAAVAIAARYNVEAAFSLLHKYGTSVSAKALSQLFGKASALRSDVLVKGIQIRSPAVREHSVQVLASRKALSEEAALSLLDDPEAAIRFQALTYLMDQGRKFSLGEAKKVLIRVSPSRKRGLFSLFSNLQEEGGEFLDRFKERMMRSLSVGELEKLSLNERAGEFDATAALYSKDYKAQFPVIASNVRDRFVAEFERRLRNSESDDESKSMESQAEQIRHGMLERTMKEIYKSGGPESLHLVRLALDHYEMIFTEEAVEYLERYGEWEDAQRLADLSGRLRKNIGILYFNTEEEKSAARGILRLGKMRSVDMFSLTLSASLLSYVVAGLANASFRTFDDETILKLLNHDAVGVRKASSLKAIMSLSKARLTRLLATYLDSEQYRYYNVIHWLDLGASTPTSFARGVASRALVSI